MNKTNKVNNSSPSSTFFGKQNEALPLANHAEGILGGLEAMWRQGALCDVTLVVGDTQFRAHKPLLASTADYFYQLLLEQPDVNTYDFEIELKGLLPSTVGTLLECMYTGRVSITEDNVQELLAAAVYLRYYSIKDACTQYLFSRLSVPNCLNKLRLAKSFELESLSAEALKLASTNFLDVTCGYDFYQMDAQHLVELLGRDDLKVENELNVFRRALSWIDFDRSERLIHIKSIMEQIRLPLLSTADIVDHVESVDYLMSTPECQRFVQEALHYHCLPARQSMLQSPRTHPRCIEKKEVVLAIGGAPRLKSQAVSTDVLYLDPELNKWNILTKLTEPRHHHAVAILGGFLYVAGGESTNDQRSPLNTAFRFDPRTNSWLKIADMKNRRESFQLGVLAGMLYAVGGRVDEDHSLSEVERYNPSIDKWESIASISTPRRSVCVASHAGRLYAMGGSGQKRISSRVERYNPMTDQWDLRRSLPTPRFFALLEGIGDYLYLFGGATLGRNGKVTCVKEVERYNPSTDTWVTLAAMLEPRAEAGSAVFGETIFVFGGYNWDDNVRLQSAECYVPQKNEWQSVPHIDHAYTGIAGATLTVFDVTASYGEEEEGNERMTEQMKNLHSSSRTSQFSSFTMPRKASSLMQF